MMDGLKNMHCYIMIMIYNNNNNNKSSLIMIYDPSNKWPVDAEGSYTAKEDIVEKYLKALGFVWLL